MELFAYEEKLELIHNIGFKTTLSMCNTKWGLLKDNADYSETLPTKVMATGNTNLGDSNVKDISQLDSKESLDTTKNTRFKSHTWIGVGSILNPFYKSTCQRIISKRTLKKRGYTWINYQTLTPVYINLLVDRKICWKKTDLFLQSQNYRIQNICISQNLVSTAR